MSAKEITLEMSLAVWCGSPSVCSGRHVNHLSEDRDFV